MTSFIQWIADAGADNAGWKVLAAFMVGVALIVFAGSVGRKK
jgi:hypothetical protein